jgi:peptide/nickel transport system permease protein
LAKDNDNWEGSRITVHGSTSTDGGGGVAAPAPGALEAHEPAPAEAEERIYVATQWQLIWWRFRKHKLGLIGSALLIIMYAGAVFCDFFCTMDPQERSEFLYCPPQGIQFRDENGTWVKPFVYGLDRSNEPVTLRRIYTRNPEVKYPVNFFAEGYPYKMLGFIRSSRHLIVAADAGPLFLFGTDSLGRDMWSRVLKGGSISLFVGLLGVAISFTIGSLLGGLSGYLGGVLDLVVQRLIEFLLSIPNIPLWMALSAALPRDWSPLRIYFFITLILSLQSWCNLARALRGKVLQQRGEDFVLAARLCGASQMRVLTRHIFPAVASHLIVSLTLSIPGMILGETSLSFLGLGLRPPVISWGVLLQQAQNARTIALQPWLLIPALFVIVVVLSFNFAGDGLRDAADPYAR